MFLKGRQNETDFCLRRSCLSGVKTIHQICRIFFEISLQGILVRIFYSDFRVSSHWLPFCGKYTSFRWKVKQKSENPTLSDRIFFFLGFFASLGAFSGRNPVSAFLLEIFFQCICHMSIWAFHIHPP